MNVYMAVFGYFAICILMWKTVEKSRKFSTGLWKSLWIVVKSSKIKDFFHRFFHNFCGNLLSSLFDKKTHFLLFSQIFCARGISAQSPPYRDRPIDKKIGS